MATKQYGFNLHIVKVKSVSFQLVSLAVAIAIDAYALIYGDEFTSAVMMAMVCRWYLPPG